MAKQVDPHDIDEFHDYLKDCLNRIAGICDSRHDGQCRAFKKILLFAFLDGLSTSVIPETEKYINKMGKLISAFGGWEGADRISLPHLCQWLSLNPESMNKEEASHYHAMLNEWSDGELRSIADDPELQDVLSSTVSDNKELRNITHAGLLSHQRHCLIHEFMHNGANIEFSNASLPYYIHLSPFPGIGNQEEQVKEAWLLVYPTGFLFQLAETCLKRARQYWGDKNLDPRSSYSTGFYLWPRLNCTEKEAGT